MQCSGSDLQGLYQLIEELWDLLAKADNNWETSVCVCACMRLCVCACV